MAAVVVEQQASRDVGGCGRVLGSNVMLKVYAKYIDGQRDVASQRILDALAA
ncbi:hypothetical protein [Streptosporangium sp. NPDC000396]|uniref:hypothetical protein n=1 Tax=Streptosporangium sp. NPDC000396 TaxID=3366185 RepID=UPI0036A2D728